MRGAKMKKIMFFFILSISLMAEYKGTFYLEEDDTTYYNNYAKIVFQEEGTVLFEEISILKEQWKKGWFREKEIKALKHERIRKFKGFIEEDVIFFTDTFRQGKWQKDKEPFTLKVFEFDQENLILLDLKNKTGVNIKKNWGN